MVSLSSLSHPLCYDGTSLLQFDAGDKYIKSTGSAASSYYMTLHAMDPTGGSSLQTFQTKVSEEGFGQFILTCNIARIRGETDDRKGAMYVGAPFPEWPPENPFENHYLVKESELQDNDWIRLYLELAVAHNRRQGGSLRVGDCERGYT